MKIETYEAFIDGCIEAVKIALWAIACSVIMFIVLMMIFTGVKFLFLPEAVVNILYHIVPASVIISTPLTMFWYWYRKAYREHNISRFRDFWLGFSTTVTISHDVVRKEGNDIEKWIDENLRHMYKTDRAGEYMFASKSDAVAFKLRWM